MLGVVNTSLVLWHSVHRQLVACPIVTARAAELGLELGQVGMGPPLPGEEASRERALVAAFEAGRGDDMALAQIREADGVLGINDLCLFQDARKLSPLACPDQAKLGMGHGKDD